MENNNQSVSNKNSSESIIRNAELSACKKYRYSLSRQWSDLPKITFVGLNPSRADYKVDDPTIRRCTNFAHSWGFGGFDIVNLFAFRSHSPKDLENISNPVGNPENRKFLKKYVFKNEICILMWGNKGSYLKQHKSFFNSFEPSKIFYCFGITKTGQPKHPLYLKKENHYIEYPKL